jgi:hypothetical protein
MRKTARPVVWEGDRAYPRSLDLINDFNSLRFFVENYVTLGQGPAPHSDRHEDAAGVATG